MILAGIVLFIHISEDFRGGIRSNDIHTYWQYARNILTGKGFVGNTLSSLQAWSRGLVLRPISIIGQPVVHALCFLMIKDWIFAAVFSTCMCYLLTIPLIFVLAQKWFGKATAVLASVFFIFNQKSVLFTLFGGSDPLFALLLVVCILILFTAKTKKAFIIGGLTLGLAAITRPVGPMYIPPILGFVWLANTDMPRLKRLSVMLIVILCSWGVTKMVPIINIHVFDNASIYAAKKVKSGKAGAMLAHSPIYPSYTAKRMLEMPDKPLKMIIHTPYVRRGIINKIRGNLKGNIPGFVKDLNATWRIGWLFLLGLFVPTGDDQKKYALKLWVVLCLMFQLAILCMSLYAERYLFPMMPFSLILAAAAAVKGVDLLHKYISQLGRPVIYTGLLAFFLLPLPIGGSIIHDPRLAIQPRPDRIVDDYVRFGNFLNSVVPEGENLFTDGGPWLEDVYGGGSRILATYPYTIEMATRMHKEKARFDNFIITSLYGKNDPMEWVWLYKNPQEFLGFKPFVYEQDSIRAVLYCRDSKKEAGRLTALAKQPDSNIQEKLHVLGRALIIDPNNRQALLELAHTRNDAEKEGAVHLEKSGQMLASNHPMSAFEELIAAGTLTDVIRPQGAHELARKLAQDNLIKKITYTHHPGFEPKITLNGFPCSDFLTDRKHNPSGRNNYLGGSADIYVDFGKARQTDEIVFKSFNMERRYLLTALNIYSSTDSVTWKKAGHVSLDAYEPQGNTNIIISNIGTFSRFLKIEAKGNGFLPVNAAELEISGWTHNTALSSMPIRKLHNWEYNDNLHITKMHNSGGRVINKVRYADENKDSRCVMAFGRYVKLEPGSYNIRFRIMAHVPEDADNLKIFSIDAAKNNGRTVILKKSYLGKELDNNNGYKDYSLNLILKDREEIEPRLFFEGRGAVSCSMVKIQGIQNAATIRIDCLKEQPEN